MAGPRMCWLAAHEPEGYQATRWALQAKDWLRLCLTDALAADPSDASATLLYHLPADDWADDLIVALGLRRELFAPLSPSGARAGTLLSRAARATRRAAEPTRRHRDAGNPRRPPCTSLLH